MPAALQNAEMPTTQWSIISRLRGKDAVEANAALDVLCRAYHYPLYCQIRRRGLSHHDAEDALHEFFIKLLRLDTLGVADSEKGRLRTFLLVALRRFLANWQRDQQRHTRLEISTEALKDIAKSEERFQIDEAVHHESPDLLYDRQWAQELMRLVLQRLSESYTAKGRGKLFQALQPVLLSGGSLSDHDSGSLAAQLSMNPGALRTALHRMLEDFRTALRHEILQTVEDREMAKTEYEELMRAMKAR